MNSKRPRGLRCQSRIGAMALTTAIILATLLSPSVSVRAEQGFTPLDQARLPAPVRQGSDSIYKLVYESPYQVNHEGKPLRASVTAFLAGSNDTLITVRHLVDKVVEHWSAVPENKTLLVAEQAVSGSQALTRLIRSGRLPLRFRVEDREGRTVFSNQDPNSAPATVLTYFDPQSFLEDIYHVSMFWTAWEDGAAFFKEFSETVALRLPVDLPGKPLELRALQPSDQKLHMIGFPSVTQTRGKTATGESLESDGKSLLVSVGSRISARESFERANRKRHFSPTQLALLEQALYFTDLDGMPGNSGSPIFAEDGKVVGMAVALLGWPSRVGQTIQYDTSRYLGSGIIAVNGSWMKTLTTLTDLNAFRAEHRARAEQSLMERSVNECPARVEGDELVGFLRGREAAFERKATIAEAFAERRGCDK